MAKLRGNSRRPSEQELIGALQQAFDTGDTGLIDTQIDAIRAAQLERLGHELQQIVLLDVDSMTADQLDRVRGFINEADGSGLELPALACLAEIAEARPDLMGSEADRYDGSDQRPSPNNLQQAREKAAKNIGMLGVPAMIDPNAS